MKKNTRRELELDVQTIRSLSKVDERELTAVVGGIYKVSDGCYTRYNSGCP